MGIELRRAARDDIVPLLQLNVADDQQDFVVHNAMTIAQAAFEPNTDILGIWAGNRPVGLTTLVDMRNYPYADDGHDPMSGYIWRIMIDREHQRHGYGRAALRRVEDWANARHLRHLFVAAVETNIAALALYRALGYRPTGRVVAGEMELSKPLQKPLATRKRA